MVKPETEISWIVNLLTERNLSNSLFSKRGGSIPDFERYAKAPLRGMEFRHWFDKMIKMEAIKFKEDKDKTPGFPTKIYFLDEKVLIAYLDTFEYYQRISRVVIKNFERYI